MSTVYQHQLHAHGKPKRWRKRIVLIVLLLLLLIGAFIVWQQLKPKTKISAGVSSTTTIKGAPKGKVWHQDIFSITLPADWKFVRKQQDIHTIYHFTAPSTGKSGQRLLDVYVDSHPDNFAVNRMLPVVAAEGGKLYASTRDVSDNCTVYTIGATTARTTVQQLAKWQNIEFLCDMANTMRNVVGIGSVGGGINNINLTSLSTGKHRFFLTYTENNDKPDYGVFVSALNSLQVDQ